MTDTTKTIEETKELSLITSTTSKDLSKDLMSLEGKIRTAQKSFYIIGEALNSIVNRGMYKERGYSTFDSYVQDTFDMKRDYAYKMINAFCVSRLLTDAGYKGSNLPKTESQCRPLAKLMDSHCELIVTIWAEVLKSPKVTAMVINNVVKQALNPSKTETKEETQEETKEDTHDTSGAIDTETKDTSEKSSSSTKESTSDAKGFDVLDILGDNADSNDADDVQALRAEIEALRAEKIQLETALLKAQTVKSGTSPRSKMAIELYKAGFKALASSCTDEQMTELMTLKKQLIG